MIKMSIIDRLLDIPEKYIYALLFLALAVPMIKPIGLPIDVTDLTRKYYNAVEGLTSEDTVFIGYDAVPQTEMEIGLSSRAVLRHLFKRDVNMIIGGSTSVGPILWEETLKDIGAEEKFLENYGEKYVYLGFIPGGETAIAALAANIRAATGGIDFYGNKLDDLSLMKDFNGAEDFEYVFAVDETMSDALWYMNQ
ncbi:unnamed protein product [marine sediment metagenome]|uniref:Uncharacterized protein n=1 Tax=marine sediment metagenome TaxID=412755 RepID=X1CIU1_9ZZZZ